MASSDFNKNLVVDSRISNLTSSINYGVYKGASTILTQKYKAVSSSVNAHVFNIAVPSQETCVDRNIMWEAEMVIKITQVAAGAGNAIFNYGTDTALSQFPLNSLINNAQCSVNNASISQDMSICLPALKRLMTTESMEFLEGITPTLPDSYFNYIDGVDNYNVLGDIKTNTSPDFKPRGSWTIAGVFTDQNCTAVPLAAIAAGAAARAGFTGTELYIKFKVCEPLMFAPWTFGNPQTNSSALYGLSNLSFNFQMSSDAARCLKTKFDITSAQVVSYTNSELTLTYLTMHPEQLLNSKCVSPYYSLDFQITPLPRLQAGNKLTVMSNSIQLNSLFDQVIMYVRRPQSSVNCKTSDSFYKINRVNITMATRTGLCSNLDTYGVYRASKRNGLNMSWHEFNGYSSKSGAAQPFIPTVVPMVGSIVVLDLVNDIGIEQSYFAPGSLTNTNFLVQLEIENQSAADETPELVILFKNSGVLVTEKGQANVFQGILTKEDVLSVSDQEPVSTADIHRIVGSGFLDKIKSVSSKVLPVVKKGLSMCDNENAQKAVNVLDSLGYGRSGGKLSKRLM
jgi:hypothetical protein